MASSGIGRWEQFGDTRAKNPMARDGRLMTRHITCSLNCGLEAREMHPLSTEP
jgi:hypothetical protein